MTNTPVIVLHVSREFTPFQEAGGAEVASLIAETLRSRGRAASVAEFSPSKLSDLSILSQSCIVFNLVYGCTTSEHQAYSQADTTSLLERAGMDLIGSPAAVQHLAQDKALCAAFLDELDILSPRTFTRKSHEGMSKWILIKPRFGAAHRNISIISCDQLTEEHFKEDYLVQEYIDGDEYTVGVVEIRGIPYAFAPLQLCFQEAAPHALGTTRRWDVISETSDKHDLRAIATYIFQKLGMRAYARVDFRVSPSGTYILDVNSLPNLHPENSFLPLSASAEGWSYADLIHSIVESKTDGT